jgi:biotin operon repressor
MSTTAVVDPITFAPCRIESFADITQYIKARYLVRPPLEDGAIAMLFGPSGHGKTFVGLDLACSIATGLPWGGMETRKSHVLYITAEGGRGFGRRVLAWYKHHRTGRENPRQLHADLDRNFHVIRHAVQVHNPNVRADLIKAISEHILTMEGEQIGLIVVDTLARCAAGLEENSSPDMTSLVNALADIKVRLGTDPPPVYEDTCNRHWQEEIEAVEVNLPEIKSTTTTATVDRYEPVMLLIHHTGKNAFDEARQLVERGSSGLKAALDVVIGLEPATGAGPAALVTMKMKEEAPLLPMAVTFDDSQVIDMDWDVCSPVRARVAMVGAPGSTCSTVQRKQATKAKELDVSDQNLLNEIATNPKSTMRELSQALGTSKSGVERAIKRLIESGQLVRENGKYLINSCPTVPNSPFGTGGTTPK